MFVDNNDLCKHTLNLVRHISVPKSHSLLGIHPILSILCNTDQGSLVIEKLKASMLKKGEKNLLTSVVEYCIHSSIYPHAQTVWTFNNPQSEVLTLKSYLDGDTTELEDVIRLHNDTYPFIAVEEHYTDPPFEKRSENIQTSHSVTSRPCQKKDLPLRENETSHRTTPTVLVPTLALGSLYVLSKLASED